MTVHRFLLHLFAQGVAVLLVLCGLGADASGQAATHVAIEDVRVCPASNADTAPPDYGAATCRSVPIQDLDPQGTHIWARFRLPLAADNLRGDGPFGLMVMGKMSSEVFINGNPVGTNGRPGDDRRSEIAGRIDTSLFVPHTLVQPGDNIIDIRMSSHRGWLNLVSPVHAIWFGRYQDPTRIITAAYWPSLITFGVFLVGLVFFGVTAWRNEDRSTSSLLAAAALFAGTELLVETARGLVAYPYPFHDVRLILITLCAAGFGLCILAYLLERMTTLGWRSRLVRIAIVLVVLIPVVIIMPGFDGKTVGVLTSCAVAGLAWSVAWAKQGRRGARALLGAFAVFLLALFYIGSHFLDVGYFYAAAGVLAFAMYQQAQSLVAERRQRRLEARRALKLETALDQARQKSAPAQIQLVSAGRVDYVSTDRIVQLKAAGDYVELHFEDGRTSLYTGTLAGLENELPPAFLRVHRSHVVNTLFVSALEREASGTGELVLSNGCRVPVSRRIMPSVRSALAEQGAAQ
ncbi:LytTR family DNA-binding domain-containing protein [Maricaulis sp.]|uniref:LytTR family DNA-binding domain-containing protein n=1 Tax=Maricaulis sp. TaxID=1486257 RepID=UPI002B27684F|nr:LytTR family DNA-binding domain-containing protein [Maricaulis sp.]